MSNEILLCSNVCKHYGKKTALENVSLSLVPGRFVGLLGPNGSGKSTLMRIIAGVLSADMGEVKVSGFPVGKHSKALVSYLPDTDYLPSQSIARTLDQFADFFPDFDREKAKAMLQHLQIDTKMLPGKISKGSREKLQLAIAMSRQAKLYLLDEPMGGIDPAARTQVIQTILSNYAEDASVLLATHQIADVEMLLDEAVFLKNGNILTHRSVDALRAEEGKSVDAYFREVFKC